MRFNSFNFGNELQEGLEVMGFKEATPIQQKAIPIIQRNEDLIACAQTGTGKTAAFVLPILDKLSSLPGSYFVSTNKIYTDSKEIFSNAFKKVDIKLVFVPYKSSPVELFNFLNREGCLD